MTEILQSIFPIDQHVWVHNPQPHTTLSKNQSLLVLGEQNWQLLALPMQAAVSEATKGGQVLFIAPHRITSLPPRVSGMPHPTPVTMQNIRFLYANNVYELQSYLGSLHHQPPQQLPTLIVVDGVEHYAKCTLDIYVNTELEQSDEPQPGPSNRPDPKPNDKSIKKDIKSTSLMVVYTQLGTSKVKLPEVEKIAYYTFQQVWTLTNTKKVKNATDIDYKLSQGFHDKAFEITFTHVDSNKPNTSSHLHLNQILLCIEEEKDLEEKGTKEKEKLLKGDKCDSVSNTAMHIQEVMQRYSKNF
ncbi:uncharacterized protein LOC143025490 isoform X2 [Oratosquilla oratoria]|uniref:uncharacterized protein LOC143025490 isoform X2 n=1 Tax=Oratosquilla oratoria TaxID=337810 RepID=UPI003F76C8A3